jgi:hypothetical protein
MDRTISGSPTIVTAPGGRWEWRSAAAMSTGLPTVAGWAHQLVYRDWNVYYGRVRDVREIYGGDPDRRVELLSKYDVRYVYVGPEERARYDIWNFTLLDGVSVAYENDEVTVYRVDPDDLGYALQSVDSVRLSADAFWINETVATFEHGSITVSGDDETLAWYGPYVTLPPGTYVATFNVTVSGADETPVVTVDVARGATRGGASDFRVLGQTNVTQSTVVDGRVEVTFTLAQPATDVEFRGTLADGNGTVELHNVTVRSAESTPARRLRSISDRTPTVRLIGESDVEKDRTVQCRASQLVSCDQDPSGDRR